MSWLERKTPQQRCAAAVQHQAATEATDKETTP